MASTTRYPPQVRTTLYGFRKNLTGILLKNGNLDVLVFYSIFYFFKIKLFFVTSYLVFLTYTVVILNIFSNPILSLYDYLAFSVSYSIFNPFSPNYFADILMVICIFYSLSY